MRIPRIPQVVDGYSLEPMSQADILNCHALQITAQKAPSFEGGDE